MTVSPSAARRLCVAMLAPAVFLGTQGARAQNGQAPVTVPGLDTYSLPAQPERPTPLQTPEPKIAPLPRPTPSATPTPAATPASPSTPAVVAPPPVRPTLRPAAVPTPTATPAARPTPVPTPTPTAAAAPAPVPTATPTPTSAPTPIPSATPTPAAAPPAASGSGTLAYWAAGVGLIALLAGVLFYRRQRRGEGKVDIEPVAPPAMPVEPEPRPVAPIAPIAPEPVALPRARVEIDLEVKRAGTNLLSAAVEYRIILRNAGEVDARGIALDLRLFGVEPGLEPALEALFAAPVGQPVVARFDLAAGATAALEGTAMLPRGAMPPLPLQGVGDGEGRALFVPVMTVNLHYGWAHGSGQSAASFVVGVDRGADAKLGPFRLDGAPRMYDRVRHLPFTVSRAV